MSAVVFPSKDELFTFAKVTRHVVFFNFNFSSTKLEDRSQLLLTGKTIVPSSANIKRARVPLRIKI